MIDLRGPQEFEEMRAHVYVLALVADSFLSP